MKGSLIIAAREVRDKKLLFLGAIFFAVIVLASPLFSGARSYSPVEVMTTSAMLLAPIPLLATCVFLGLGVIARDLEEGRMGFYLARPVPTISIWIGKTVATIVIAFVPAFLILLVPTLLGGGLFSILEYATNEQRVNTFTAHLVADPIQNASLLALVVLAQAQFWGLGLRTRSPWLLLDLAGFTAAGTIFWIALRPFLLSEAISHAVVLTLASVIGATILIMTANVLGFHLGRSDLGITHRWTSIITVALLFVGGTGAFLYSATVRSIVPGDLVRTSLLAASEDGDWIATSGGTSTAPHTYETTFLINTATQAFIETPHSMIELSDDGTIAILWKRETIDPPVARLYWIDLSKSRNQRRTELTRPLRRFDSGGIRWPWTVISPEGSKIAWIDEDTLQIYDVREERSLFTVRIPDGEERRQIIFPNESSLLMYTTSWDDEGVREWTIREVDIRQKSWSITGTLQSRFLLSWLVKDKLVSLPSRSDDKGPRRYELRDQRDGSIISSYESPDGGTFLRDGRFVEFIHDGPAILIHGPNEPEKRIVLPAGEKIVSLRDLGHPFAAIRVVQPRKTLIVNLSTSETQELSDPSIELLRQSTSGHTIARRDNKIVLFDPETLEPTYLAGGN